MNLEFVSCVKSTVRLQLLVRRVWYFMLTIISWCGETPATCLIDLLSKDYLKSVKPVLFSSPCSPLPFLMRQHTKNVRTAEYNICSRGDKRIVRRPLSHSLGHQTAVTSSYFQNKASRNQWPGDENLNTLSIWNDSLVFLCVQLL